MATNTIRIAIPALGLVLLTACFVALVLGKVGPFSDSDERSGLAAVADPGPASEASIPALDAAAPAKTEMATFALG